ncbi:MAG TPA: uroporphyrinogen decarboxylase family protein [Gemmatales bacterium]|nr:uroporphyrinogen decarboxylase family protein [Gemmatales bacterium]
MTADLLRATLAGQPTPRPPVWAMRQAGRWDPEFQRLRGQLDFFAFTQKPDLAAAASLLPRRFGVDAIILFYDITTLAVAMGLPFQMVPEAGPRPVTPIRSLADVDRLAPEPDPARYGFLLEVLDRVRRELAGALPILVFAGAPFTLASYCLGAGSDIAATRRFAADQPQVWSRLLGRIETATVSFIRTLAQNGADAWQLFDSWAGSLAREEYLAWAHPHHRSLFAALPEIPGILFVKEGPELDLMAASGAQAVSLGTRHDLADALRQWPELIFQGNVSDELLRAGSPADVAAATRRCLEAGGGQRHIVNLSHGCDRATPVANFQALVDTVRNWTGPSS